VRWAAVRGSTSGRAAGTADIRDFVATTTVGIPVHTDVSWPDGGKNDPGKRVVVTVTYPFAPIAPLPLVPKTINLTSKSTMVISR